jgi:patatin-related protein
MIESLAQPSEIRELRLAVVCYGGVSLAIYMHGSTKELHRLVKASALLDHGADAAAYEPTETVYRKLLQDLQDRHPDKARTRVLVDIIAGTSAGGINGVYLAKALAHNRSQDALRDLWLDKGDIGTIMRGWTRIPWWMRTPWLLLRARRKAPLHGDSMSVWLYDALQQMDKERKPAEIATLMPRDHRLELYVTTTDFYGYNRSVTLAGPETEAAEAPTSVFDWRHRHVLTFRYGNGFDDFRGSGDNAALAFSARATSSFPGAFPPVNLEGFLDYLRDRAASYPDRFTERYFRHYALSDASATGTFFVDGGVLDNRPFGYAIAAIRAKPATGEVSRRLLYLEPDPGSPGKSARERHEEPGTIANALGALSGIPRKEPILDDLLNVAVMNERVRRIRDVIEESFDAIDRRVRALIRDLAGKELEELSADPTEARIQDWRELVNVEAAKNAGFGYSTYIRMKISGIVDRYARTVCEITYFPPDTDQAYFVKSVLRSWARDRLLFDKCTPPSPVQLEFIQNFDLEYSQRRLRFLIDGLNWYYRDRARHEADVPVREELDRVKARLSEAVRLIEETIAGSGSEGEVKERLLVCFDEAAVRDYTAERGFSPRQYAIDHREELDALGRAVQAFLGRKLKDFNVDLYRDLNELTSGWDAKRRADLFVRYLGFPFWDILLYPLQTLDDLGERDHVQVTRMSPRDASLLSEKGEAKLAGISKGHFGAFFDRAGREKDYLWGRLDGAERLIAILLGPKREQPLFEAWCAQAFSAILEEEADALPQAKDVIGDVRAWLAEHAPAQPVSV